MRDKTLPTSDPFHEKSSLGRILSYFSQSFLDEGVADFCVTQWIDREGQEDKRQELKEKLNFTWKFNSMGEMAEAVEKEFLDTKEG